MPSTSPRTLDLSKLPPPIDYWPTRVVPDVLPFENATFDRAVVGLDALNASRLHRLLDELGRVVVVGGEIELVVRDDERVDGLKMRLRDLLAATLRAFDVHAVTSNDGRLAVHARNVTRRPVKVNVEVVDSTADAAAALICVIRDRDIEQSRRLSARGAAPRAGEPGSPSAGRPWRIEVANRGGAGARATVRFEPASLPTRPPRRPDLRVAAVLGERSRLALRYEFALEPVAHDSWREVFRPGPPQLLLVESACPAHGAVRPFTADGGLSRWALDLLDHCREHAVPTVFWNNDDPSNYESFLRGARSFDWVFTVDASCVDRYRADLGHDRVGVLPFAIQPRLHNPIGAFSGSVGDVAYAAACHDAGRASHTEQVDNLLRATADLGLHILLLGESGPRSGLPADLEGNVVSRVAYDQLLSAYRRYRVFLTLNPAPDSPTRLPPELLESLACGTPVISGPSSAIAPMLGSGVVAESSAKSSSRMLVKALLASTELRDRKAVEGVRCVLRDHTYAHRVDDLLKTVGLSTGPSTDPSPRPRVSIVAPTHRLGGYESIIRNVGRQTYQDFELILGLHGVDEPESRIRDAAHDSGIPNLTIVRVSSERSLGHVCNDMIEAASGPYVARMDDDDFYGPNYLEDQMRAFEYTDADLVGKWTRFIYLEKLPALGVIFPGNEHVYGAPLCGGTLLTRRDVWEAVKFADRSRGEDITFVINCAEQGFATYATDRFNYVYVRHADKSRHTYQPDDLDLLSRTRIVSFGSSLEHAFV